jgi:hypothetical protein
MAVELWFSFLFASYNGALIVLLTEIMPTDVCTAGFSLVQRREHVRSHMGYSRGHGVACAVSCRGGQSLASASEKNAD